MASTMAAAAVHSMPPFPLPAVPRIRPPPIPKGTPGPNTLPQPGRPPKPGLIWVDGRWASPRSRSVQHKQEIVSTQLEKALQHEVRGMNIYAYKHIRTHQVVYSLTKNMDNNKILKQLLYHGKKTVPAALRRDVWRPYYSVHFSKTPAGALKGLRVFQELRELSALRQLSPPKELTIATQKDVDGIKRGYDAVEWLDKTTNEIPRTKLLVPPVAGQKLPKKLLAKRLMDQKATSVADIAAALAREANPREFSRAQEQEKDEVVQADDLTPRAPKVPRTPQQRMMGITFSKRARDGQLSIRNHDRLQEIKKKEEVKADQLAQKQEYLTPKPGMIKMDAHTNDRISMEYDSVGQSLAMIDEADEATKQEIGATQKLRQAHEDIKNEKQIERQNIEKSMSAEIEKRLMSMSQAERDQIEKEVEAERAQKQAEIDAKVAETREGYKKRRAKLYRKPATAARTKALRKLSRESQAKVYAMKTELRTRHLKWAGPFAAIATTVDEAMSQIDEKWKDTLREFRKDVDAERASYANPANHEVEIRWANILDGTYAKSWPESVFHTTLQPKAVSKGLTRAVTTHSHYDADEELIETQVGLVEASRRNTVHVFGSVAPDPESDTRTKGRYETPAALLDRHHDDRSVRIQEWQETEAVMLRDRILTMRSESAEFERQFARTDADYEATPYVAGSMAEIEHALGILSELKPDSYNPQDLVTIDNSVAYARECIPYCRDELANSANPIADEARIKYLSLMVDLIPIESRNPEARHHAEVRQEYFSYFNKRERLEDAIDRFEDDADLFRKAKYELSNFDLEKPFIIEILARREAALENLPAEIEDDQAEIERLEKEIAAADPTDVDTLQTELKAEKQALQAKTVGLKKLQKEEAGGREVIREVIRQDKEAWLDFKRAEIHTPRSYPGVSTSSISSSGGAQGSEKGPMRADTRGMVMEPPQEPKRSMMSRVKGLFGR